MKRAKKCEECKYYNKRVGGCDYMHYFCLRKWGEDRPSWCPWNERKENDNERQRLESDQQG